MTYEQRLGGTHAWRKLRARALRELPLACAECGIVLNPSAPRGSATAPELDHIVPRKYGGADTLDNVRWMCAPHNRRKSDRYEPPAPQPQPPRTFVTHRKWW
jgi:5-methylcytosine-specific restriction endonuclease McrA